MINNVDFLLQKQCTQVKAAKKKQYPEYYRLFTRAKGTIVNGHEKPALNGGLVKITIKVSLTPSQYPVKYRTKEN